MRSLIRALWWLAAVVTFWAFGFAVIRSEDLWWHLAAGAWMLRQRAIPLLDPFSFTAAGRPWLNDAWLADLLFAVWSHAFGVETLVWWKWGLVVATFLVLMRTCRRLTDDEPVSAYLPVVLGAAVAEPFLDLRPQLYSFLGVALVLEIALGRERPSLLLPILFAVWANLHAGFLFGLGALAIVLAPRVLRGPRPARIRAIRVGALSIAACLANPNGVRVFTRPFGYALDVTSPFRQLMEWRPPFQPGGAESAAYPYAIVAFAAATALALALQPTRRREATWVGVALGGLSLAMSLTSRRFVPLFAMTQALVLAPVLRRLSARLIDASPALLAPAVAALVGVAWLAPYPLSSLAFHYLTAEDNFPVETCDFIAANGLRGNVFAQYGWAGYVSYRTRGQLQVYIDGRADAVYDGALYTRYTAVAYGQEDWFEILRDSDAEYLLWPRYGTWKRLPAALVGSGRWRRVYEDAVSLLLVRADRSAPEPLSPAPDSAWHDYALGVFALERGNAREAETHLEQALARAPYLRNACDQLAHARVLAGDDAAGWETIARCQRIFPLRSRLEWFRGIISDPRRP
jgi:hypothetical protein